MSTMDVIMTDRSEQHTHSEHELYHVADLVLWTSIPTLTAREIVQRSTVSKSWAAWASKHKHLIVQAWRGDVTRDWYFPLLAKNLTNQRLIPPYSWSWTGIWHATADHSADTVHSLPPLVHQWTRLSRPHNDIIACSGGLLLIKLLIHYSAGIWHPLLVCNPFTKECRERPEATNILASSLWLYSGVQAQMVVDDDSNSYKRLKYINKGVELMPMMFHIFQIYKGTIVSHRRLCMEIPQARKDIRFRRESLFQLTTQYHQPLKNWFSCTAVGSVLWVAVEDDYVLQYDVVSKESKTQIIAGLNQDDDHLGFAYRSNLHMKP